MSQPLIQFERVYKAFGDNLVLEDINLSIFQGEITTIIGKSGDGKSVLLKHMIGLLHPDSGRILFRGRPFSEMKRSEKKALKRQFSYMFQGTALFDSMTVFDNIALPLKETKSVSKKDIKTRVVEKMQQFDLDGIGEKYPSQISGGMKKRVALARALVTGPEIILFDEPTTGLDPIRKNAVNGMISDYQKRFGFTGVVVSHDLPDIFYISQRVIMLDKGRVIFEGSPEEIQYVSDPTIREFVRGFESRHAVSTGIAPLSQGEKRFKEEMARLQRHETVFSVILFTVENLDEINEKAGHVAGQTAFNNFMMELQRQLRITDTCYRYDRNKVMVLLPNTDMNQSRNACIKLSSQIKIDHIIAKEPYVDFCFSVSAGFAEARENNQLEHLLTSALSSQRMFYEFRVC